MKKERSVRESSSLAARERRGMFREDGGQGGGPDKQGHIVRKKRGGRIGVDSRKFRGEERKNNSCEGHEES